MPEWRQRATDLFPELRKELADPDEIRTPNDLWFELLPLTRAAHRAANDDLLKRIYGYAAWSHDHGGEPTNAVGVSFYEHLLDEPWMRPLVVPWLSERIIEVIRPLWTTRLSPNEMNEVDKLLRAT